MSTGALTAKKKHTSELSFTTGSIPKTMLKFVGPFLLAVLVQNLYGAVDLFVVGHYATTADVSAVTIGSQIMNIVTQVIIGFATGITVLIGRHFGANDQRGLARTTGTSIVLFGLLAAVLTAIYIGFHQMMVSMMQTPAEAIGATKEYLFVCSIGIVFIVGYNVAANILTGMGDSRTPFLFVVIACLINVTLDIILVRYFHMGALGAAVATTIAQAGSFIFSLIYLRRKGLGFPFAKRDIRFDKPEVGRILKIGGPVAIQNSMVGISFLFITAIINQIGLAASAAVGVVEKLILFLFVPAIALGTAVSTASSQNIGAGHEERARKSMWWGVLMGLVPGIIFTIFCQFNGGLLTGILTSDPEVVGLAAEYLKSNIYDVILVSFVFCMNGFFNSCGKSWFSLLHSMISTFAIRIPLAYLFSTLQGATLFTIGLAAPISTVASMVLCFLFLAHMNRKKKKQFSGCSDKNSVDMIA